MVSYKTLGLVNTKEMFARAINGGYAVPAFNFNNLEQLQAIIKASSELKSPVILQVSKGARNYANQTLLRYMAEGAVEYAKELGCAHPEIVLHLDHGDSFELCKSCVDMGFSSVMIDGSSLPYDENVALTKKVVDYAHQYDVTVEGELGVLAGVEDEVASEESHYTKPEEVIDFTSKTGVDSLLQVQARAVHARPEDRPPCSSSFGFRRSRRNHEEVARIPDRTPRLVFSSAGICRHDQPVRRQAARRSGHSRGAAPQGSQERRLQDQHRLRLSSGLHRSRPQDFGRETGRVRPA